MSDAKMLSMLIILTCLVTEMTSQEIDYCYANEWKPYLLTATKTPYQFVYGGRQQPPSVPNCEPLQIWLLARHGTRFPAKDEIEGMLTLSAFRDNIVKNHEAGRGRLCNADLENLKKWTLDPSIKNAQEKSLTEQGERDLNLLGERFRNNYPELLRPNPTDVTPKNYKFRAADTQRTIKSMTSFIKGVFGSPTAVNFTEVVPVEKDMLLKAYSTCGPWRDLVNNPSSTKEINELMNGTEYAKMIASVSRRLGFLNNITLYDINLLYQTCRFENAFMAYKLKLSPWCAVFNEDEMRLLEYEEDLFHYYYSSYGVKLSKDISCLPLQDIYNRFEALEKSDHADQPKGVFYFAHATTIQLFYVSMGLYKDPQPLTAANYQTMHDRLWRTSYISPFTMNVAAIFYKCNSTGSKHKVVFKAGETNLFLDDCENGICDWEFIKNRVRSTALSCNLDFCNSSGSAAPQSQSIMVTFLSIFLIWLTCQRSQ